ncbi:MAG: glycosyl hydrolase [Planctomycetota bacterium]|nr:glycosyl hydrolase [Planctomycetota bacterium]
MPHRSSCRPSTFTGIMVILLSYQAWGADGVERAGAGSYLTRCPAGAKEPPATIYKTDNVRGPVPTGDWWSSLAWLPFSEPLYAHPLVLRAEPEGMRVYHADKITANKVGIFGPMAAGKNDLVLGHSARARFPDARLQDFSDWFVTASFAADGKGMKVTCGHGSPYVYAVYEGGDPTLSFANAPEVWAGGPDKPVLGLKVNGKPYGLFGPSGCNWAGLGSKSLTCNLGGKNYFSIALLPDKSPATLDLFARYAYAHVTGSKIAWSYDEKTATVATRFSLTTKAFEGQETATLYALYPHQWMRTQDKTMAAVGGTESPAYPSVRGQMRVMCGNGFATQMVFPGVLPSLPDQGTYDKAVLRKIIAVAVAKKDNDLKDTYWGGKRLGWLATLLPIAEEARANACAAQLRLELRERLEEWFSAAGPSGQPKSKGCFYLNKTWGTLIGYPASYGSDTDLSDHHFHYGYFVRAAAELARHDPAWAGAENWGAMVRLLIRDIASPDHDDPLFPFLRTMDPYAGHSWASGKAAFFDGNNNESSSEAMNAWTGVVLFGQAVGDTKLRDLGIYLYTTEMEAINQYWFDVENRHRPASYTPSVVTMVWGGKSVNETWFSNKPPVVHGINWLPFHGGSLYLGRYPEYTRRNYQALVDENNGDKFDEWACLAMMYRALHDPADAVLQYDANPDGYALEGGNSRANVYHWIHNLNAMGQVDRDVTADYPLYAVFKKNASRTYVVYNMEGAARTVTFSDGVSVQAAGRGLTVKAAAAK